MPDNFPNLGLPIMQPAQAQKHVTHNEALRILDSVTQLVVLDRTRTAPPPLPTLGDRHIVASGATGAWVGQDHAIATRNEDAWQFDTPQRGWIGYDADNGDVIHFNGTTWALLPQPDSLSNLTGVGILSTPDSTNRLSVTAPASLFNHQGAGHQIKVNKAAPANTASHLFQTGFSGRAEIGLAGTDAFTLKVSSDGSTWLQAFEANAATTQISLAPAGTVTALFSASALDLSVPVTGTAVQQSNTDTTTGRLMLAQHGVLRSAIAGTVSQSGGIPTGAIIERGTNASGQYTRWADGTQICTRTVSINMNIVTAQDFAFPAAFTAIMSGSSTGATLSQSTGTGAANRMRALGTLPLICDTTTWRVQFDAVISADTVNVALMAIGRWY